MAKLDLPVGWESEGDTVFVESNQKAGAQVGVILLIFAGVFGFDVALTAPSDFSIAGPICVILAGVGLFSIWNSLFTWRWEINLADKSLMLKKIRGSQTKVRRDRDLGQGAWLEIVASGYDKFAFEFGGPDWNEALGRIGGYSRTRGFAESLSDAIGIEIVDERRRGLPEDSEIWWEQRVEHDSEPEERMDMRMATRDPDARIDESVIDGHIRLKGNSKMLGMTLVFGVFVVGVIVSLVDSGAYDILVIAFLLILFMGYSFLIGIDAWTSVSVHDDKLVLRRLIPARIDSITYKEVSKSSISAIGLERIWHEDDDD